MYERASARDRNPRFEKDGGEIGFTLGSVSGAVLGTVNNVGKDKEDGRLLGGVTKSPEAA